MHSASHVAATALLHCEALGSWQIDVAPPTQQISLCPLLVASNLKELHTNPMNAQTKL